MADRAHDLTHKQGERLMAGSKEYYSEQFHEDPSSADFLGGDRVDCHGYRFGEVVVLFDISSSLTQPGIHMQSYGPTRKKIDCVESKILQKSGYSSWENI